MPGKLTIKPGKFRRVRVKIGSLYQGTLEGKILFMVKGMETDLPAVVPVKIVQI